MFYRPLPVDHSHVQVATGSAGGDLGPLRGLSGSTGRRAFALAGNVRGDLAVLTGDAGTERTIYLRRAGTSAFRVVLRIAMHEHPRGATVALGPKGDLLAASRSPPRTGRRARSRSARPSSSARPTRRPSRPPLPSTP